VSVQQIYCIDTSSLLEAWVRSYRPHSFPTFWQLLERLISDGRCVACEEVKSEVEKDSHGLTAWLRSQSNFVVTFDRKQEREVKKVMKDYPNIVNIRKNKGWADPFVIALASSKGYVVVTEEGAGSKEGPKIPFVCKAYGIDCISMVEMIERENWIF
jgi:hypothetical protein